MLFQIFFLLFFYLTCFVCFSQTYCLQVFHPSVPLQSGGQLVDLVSLSAAPSLYFFFTKGNKLGRQGLCRQGRYWRGRLLLLHLELSLLLRPVCMGWENPVKKFLRDGLTPPLVWGDPCSMYQGLPFVLKINISTVICIFKRPDLYIPPSSSPKNFNCLHKCLHLSNRERSPDSSLDWLGSVRLALNWDYYQCFSFDSRNRYQSFGIWRRIIW